MFCICSSVVELFLNVVCSWFRALFYNNSDIVFLRKCPEVGTWCDFIIKFCDYKSTPFVLTIDLRCMSPKLSVYVLKSIYLEYELTRVHLRIFCSPRVTFCGYSIPHPSQPRVNIRVQTTGKACVFFNLLAIAIKFLVLNCLLYLPA